MSNLAIKTNYFNYLYTGLENIKASAIEDTE